MGKMSTFQIVLISVFGLAAVVGLFLFATFSGFGGSKPLGVVNIWGTLPESAMTDSLANLRQKHQEFSKVNYRQIDPQAFDTILSEALASGDGPDLIITNQEHLLTEENKLLVIPFSQIPERTYRDTYVSANEIYLTSNGTYGLPFVVDPLVLYYNRSLLSSAQIPQVPKTWEAVLGSVPSLTRKTDAGLIQRSAIPMGTYDNIGDARAIISLLFLQAGTPISANSASGLRSTIASASQNVEVLPGDSAMSFYTQFADPAKTVYTWNRSIPDAHQCFVAGDCAFYVGFASERPGITAANPNLDFDVSSVPQPQTASANADYALAYAFAVPKATKNATGAYRTAFALSDKSVVLPVAQALSMAPAARSLLTPAANDTYGPIFYPAALISKVWLSPSPSVTDHVFAAMINDIVSGRQGVHDALVTADQALNAAL